MLKFSFYSLSLRKFEKEQFEEIEESNILKNYFKQKTEISNDLPDQDLLNLINMKQKEFFLKHSQFDRLLSEEEMEKIDQRMKEKGLI